MRCAMKFDYGQTVRYKLPSETGAVLTKLGAIVAIIPVENADQAEAIGFPTGTLIYQVEFEDIGDLLIPEQELDEI